MSNKAPENAENSIDPVKRQVMTRVEILVMALIVVIGALILNSWSSDRSSDLRMRIVGLTERVSQIEQASDADETK